MQTAMYQRIGNMPKACPYVMMHKVNQNQGNTDNLIAEYRIGRFDTTTFQEIMLSSGVFRRETARGFYPWGNVVSPRKRVAEGWCGGMETRFQ